MEVIKKLGERVEKEHDQYLRDSQRIEDRSAITQNGAHAPKLGSVDFASLVGGAGGTTAATSTLPTTEANGNGADMSWEDDVWGSLLSSGPTVCFSKRMVCFQLLTTITDPQRFLKSAPTTTP